MRKARGNIILTALFISVFLFFLSIALVWTNRQDITLVLAMEHKLKAEAAARSGAMLVFTSLRNIDQAPAVMEGTLTNGSSWKAELVELPPEGFRGPIILLRSRGTSGPLSSYYTLHLLKSELSSDASSRRRMLGFLQSASGGSEETTNPNPSVEQTPSAPPQAPLSSSAQLILGDFILQNADLNMGTTARDFAAYRGPLFVSHTENSATPPLAVVAHLPVFSPLGGNPKAYGPALISLKPPESTTTLAVMRFTNSEFSWEPIPAPKQELPDPPTPPIARLDLENPAENSWTSMATRAIDGEGATFMWRDEKPATATLNEALELRSVGDYAIDPNGSIDWGSAPRPPITRGYSLREAIAAHEQNVYSHAWEYLYRQYDGAFPPAPIPSILGSNITRWPSVRKYSLESKEWSTVWSALDDRGNVSQETIPDPKLLLVDSQERIYSRTLRSPARLLTLEKGGKIRIGRELPPNARPFIYGDQPYAASDDPKRPGFLNLIDGKVIGFETLPTHLPEIAGPLLASVSGEFQPIQDPDGLTMSPFETTPFTDPEQTQMFVVRPGMNFRYRATTGLPASDGSDLYAEIEVEVEEKASNYPKLGKFEVPKGTKTLARFDGSRWHILPNGLMATLMLSLGGSPASDIFCAHYSDLPESKSRYTVVAINIDPFEFLR